MIDWQSKAAALADSLAAAGKLPDAALRTAVSAVPRHVLVPRYYTQDGAGPWRLVDGANSDQRAEWFAAVYSDITLVTALDAGQGAVSSSTSPGLVARMIHALDLRGGQRVLEVGLGTGYNAALLCHRLGERNVYSVDIDADLVGLARERLARVGYRPTLAAVDGVDGLPGHAPYDRIIATCSVPTVPWSWAEQLTEGGLVLVDVKVAVTAGNLVLLQRHADRLEGRFLPQWAGFMTMRHQTAEAEPSTACERSAPTVTRRTAVPALPWDNLVAWFIATLDVASPLSFGYLLDEDTGQPRVATFTTSDGSWAEVALDAEDGVREVREGGPRPLWAAVEQAYAQWAEMGQPGWERLRLTVTEHQQTVWLADSDWSACLA